MSASTLKVHINKALHRGLQCKLLLLHFCKRFYVLRHWFCLRGYFSGLDNK